MSPGIAGAATGRWNCFWRLGSTTTGFTVNDVDIHECIFSDMGYAYVSFGASLGIPCHDNVVSNIADIYSDTISTFQYRIQVTGNYNYLQQNRVANQVRALLLTAIRSAILWRQLGGSRWQFLFYRKPMLLACRALIAEAKQQQAH